MDLLSYPSIPIVLFAELPSASNNPENQLVCPDYPGIGLTVLSSNGTSWIPIAGRQALDYYQTYGATRNTYYPAGVINATSLTTLALVANSIYAVPFVAGRDGILDKLAHNITTVVAGNAILGIYSSEAVTGLYYPSTLLAAGTSQSTSTSGAKISDISLPVTAGVLYHAVIATSAAITIRALPTASVSFIGGISSAFSTGGNTHLRGSRTYDGTLPSTFPTGFLPQIGSIPGIFYRWS